MKELSEHLRREGIEDYQLLVGVMSGRGEDLARLRGENMQDVYKRQGADLCIFDDPL